jgi:hypothetical protein
MLRKFGRACASRSARQVIDVYVIAGFNELLPRVGGDALAWLAAED